MTAGVRVVELDGDAAYDAWAERWDTLGHDAGALFFQSSAWVRAWSAVYQPGDRVALLVDGPPEAPEGMLPIAWMGRPIHHSVPLLLPHVGIAGSWAGAADELGPVTASASSARRLLDVAVGLAGRLPVVLPSVAERHHDVVAGLPGSQPVVTDVRAALDLGAARTVDDVWDAKFRKNLRRRRRILDDEGYTRRWVRGSDGPAAIAAALDALQELHQARWSGRGDGFFDATRRSLLDRLATASPPAPADGVWVRLIEGEEGPVAGLLGFRHGSTFCVYKSGWRPDLARLGLGLVLHGDVVEWALTEGVDRYDLLRGPHPHKLRLGAVPTPNTTFIVPNGPMGRVLLERDRLYGTRIAAQYAAAHPGEVPGVLAVPSLMERMRGRSRR